MTDDPQPPVEPSTVERGTDERGTDESGTAESGTAEPAPRTGVPDVDAVLDEVEALEDRPAAEHVAVFEDAHARLRRALEAADGPDRTAGDA